MKAFPNPSLEVNLNGGVKGWQYGNEGMDLRDYFAGKAMSAFLTSVGVVSGIAPSNEDLARYAYQMADAMMEAREQE